MDATLELQPPVAAARQIRRAVVPAVLPDEAPDPGPVYGRFYSQSEVAQIMGITQQMVAKIERRALYKMRMRLGQTFRDELT